MPETAVVRATRELLATSAQLQGLLTVVIVRAELIIKALETGSTVLDATEGFVGSETLTTALRKFETDRHEWRIAVLRGWLEQGGTLSEYASTFGFSRQYAQKLARGLRPPKP